MGFIQRNGKTLAAGTAGFLLGGFGMWWAAPPLRKALDIMGPPRVTVINATGAAVGDVVVSLGAATRSLPDLPDGHMITVRIPDRFSECSTQVQWTDATGRHVASADDYMENYGFYHAKVVLTPDRQAKAIYEVED